MEAEFREKDSRIEHLQAELRKSERNRNAAEREQDNTRSKLRMAEFMQQICGSLNVDNFASLGAMDGTTIHLGSQPFGLSTAALTSRAVLSRSSSSGAGLPGLSSSPGAGPSGSSSSVAGPSQVKPHDADDDKGKEQH